MLLENKIIELLGSCTVRVFDIIDSTNNEAKRMIEGGFRGKALVAAEAQTGGRGRLGRTFYSPKSTGLYFTVIIPPVFPIEEVSLLTPAAAVAVVRVLAGVTEKPLKIKWVNDIYAEDKKICGILAESVLDMEKGGFAGFAVGIGINISTEDFPEDIEGIAASLHTEADRNEIAAGIARELFAFAENLAAREFMPEYRERSYVTSKDIYFIKNSEKQNATAIGIDDSGGLIVKLENGEYTVLRGGEISVRIR
ncbi:MAG: biotin--[Clostridia bacterium]|nr:biotin--[acetyl-CoA-carboxylase] ligase [Clostridia bacterium]